MPYSQPSLSIGSTTAVTAISLLGSESDYPQSQVPHPTDRFPMFYQSGLTAGSRSVAEVSQETQRRPYNAKTDLVKRLVALREQAINEGLQLLTEQEILDEIARRRGEFD